MSIADSRRVQYPIPTRRPPISTRFPYTTLFRSVHGELRELEVAINELQQARGFARVGLEREVLLGGEGDERRHRARVQRLDRKSTRLNSSHLVISYAVFCLKKKIISKHQVDQQR